MTSWRNSLPYTCAKESRRNVAKLCRLNNEKKEGGHSPWMPHRTSSLKWERACTRFTGRRERVIFAALEKGVDSKRNKPGYVDCCPNDPIDLLFVLSRRFAFLSAVKCMTFPSCSTYHSCLCLIPWTVSNVINAVNGTELMGIRYQRITTSSTK